MRYEIEFYTTASGQCPMDAFLDQMPVKHAAKAEKFMGLLEEKGPDLPRPFADIVRGKIRELRVAFHHHEYRFLYFFFSKIIVMTHGFLKKSDKVPEGEIDQAQKYMDDYLGRN